MIQTVEERRSRTLAEMAAEAAMSDTGLVCPHCGCTDFRTYRTNTAGTTATQRYKTCRHCGKYKVLTSTVQVEKVIREIE